MDASDKEVSLVWPAPVVEINKCEYSCVANYVFALELHCGALLARTKLSLSLSTSRVPPPQKKMPATRRLCGPGRDRARIIRDHIAGARLRCYLGHDFTLIIAIFQINLHTLRISC